MQTRMAPYLQTRIPVRTFDAERGNIDAAPSAFDLGVSPLLRDIEFENLMNEEVFYTARTVESLEAAVRADDEILELIEAELDD